MQTLVERGCGLDVHQATVVACLLIVRKDGRVQKQMRTFGTTTRELVTLREWLLSENCTHVAMESTGVYWKPVEKDLALLEQRLEEKLQPYEAQVNLLDEIPGVDWTLAAAIIAELGVDMSVFGSVSQLASWAGLCPGNNESAGKRKSSRIPKGNIYLKAALVEAANAAAKAKGTYLRDKFYRLKARRGYKRAAVAVAHKILVDIYHMFYNKVFYNELGDLYLDTLNKHHLTRNLVHRLERLGYAVTLEQKAA